MPGHEVILSGSSGRRGVSLPVNTHYDALSGETMLASDYLDRTTDRTGIRVITVDTQPVQLTETERAKQQFLEEVQRITGVIDVSLYGGRTLAEKSIDVIVPGLFSPVARQVYEFKTRVYQRYPDADLDVSVKVPLVR